MNLQTIINIWKNEPLTGRDNRVRKVLHATDMLRYISVVKGETLKRFAPVLLRVFYEIKQLSAITNF